MLNQAQEAYDLTGGAFATGAAPDRADRRRRAPLVVVEGGHLDADARRGVGKVLDQFVLVVMHLRSP